MRSEPLQAGTALPDAQPVKPAAADMAAIPTNPRLPIVMNPSPYLKISSKPAPPTIGTPSLILNLTPENFTPSR